MQVETQTSLKALLEQMTVLSGVVMSVRNAVEESSDYNDDEEEGDDDENEGTQHHRKGDAGNEKHPTYVATRNYKAKKRSDHSLKVGVDVVHFVDYDADGNDWFWGTVNGNAREGWVPVACVEPEDDDDDPPEDKTCTATRNYRAKRRSELSLKVGDVVHLLDREGENDEWWWGRLNDREGWIPTDCVEEDNPSATTEESEEQPQQQQKKKFSFFKKK